MQSRNTRWRQRPVLCPAVACSVLIEQLYGVWCHCLVYGTLGECACVGELRSLYAYLYRIALLANGAQHHVMGGPDRLGYSFHFRPPRRHILISLSPLSTGAYRALHAHVVYATCATLSAFYFMDDSTVYVNNSS